MRRFGKALGRVLLLIVLVLGGVMLLGPVQKLDPGITFDPAGIPPDLDAYLAATEAKFPDITPGSAKRIVWARGKGERTPLSIIYLHGFSATAEEIRPVPDQVAQALGANLFFTRLAGHGRTGAAMAEATPEAWLQDTAEAMEIGRRLGDRVLIISTSTGGTLAAIVATDPDLAKNLAGIVMISPNFGVKAMAARLLDLPFAPIWGPWVAGSERSFSPANASQAAHWTTSYPTAALFPMATLVRYARSLDLTQAKVPLLLLYSPQDQVVDPEKTLQLLSGWAGPKQIEMRQTDSGDDAYHHVIAGDILSPGQTASTITLITDWAKTL